MKATRERQNLARRAFTLLEVLLVLGLLALFAAAMLGLPRLGHGAGREAEAGRALLEAMVARGVAEASVLEQEVLVVVDVRPPAAGGLREVRLGRMRETAGWEWLGVPFALPQGWWFVPPLAWTLPGVGRGHDWPPELESDGLATDQVPTGFARVVHCQPGGATLPATAGGGVVISSGRARADGVVFENARGARRILVSDYGRLAWADRDAW